MTKISLSLEKSIEKNASIYFDKAKKFKKKTEGAKVELEKNLKKLEKLKKKHQKEQKKQKEIEEKTIKPKTKKEWYEKFRWFHTSDNFLVIGDNFV